MTSMSDWLKPTILGPLIVCWAMTTLGSVLVGMHVLSSVELLGFFALGERLDRWLLGMLLMSFFGSALAVLLVTADLVLLSAKARKLPTGARAWLSSCLAPVGVFAIWTLPLPQPESVLGVCIYLVVPMAVAAFAVRYVFGEKP